MQKRPIRINLVALAFVPILIGSVFARSTKPIPGYLAKQMQASTAEYVFGVLKNHLQEDKHDLLVLELAITEIPIYLEKGSIVDTRPDVLLEELTANCNTPENPFVTLLITSLCKDYKYWYDKTPENTALHEQFLTIQAAGVSAGRDRFLAANRGLKERSEAHPLLASLGSGFIVSSDGYVLTNNHVVANATKITVVVPDHGRVSGSVVLSDGYKDLALLKVPLSNLPCISIADSNLVHVLNTVYVLGYPLASELGGNVSASEGKINAIRDDGRMQLFQFDADVNAGNSGGPVLNDKGEAVGVVVAKLDAIAMLKEHGSLPERINFAIPINEARDILRKAYPHSFALSAKEGVLSSVEIFDSTKGATVLIEAIQAEQNTPSTDR
jgi:S1-C subfamily serine protease